MQSDLSQPPAELVSHIQICSFGGLMWIVKNKVQNISLKVKRKSFYRPKQADALG
jgi:hypothetical protein